MSVLERAAELGYVPDAAIRWGIRRLIRRRLGPWRALDAEAREAQFESFVAMLGSSPVAVHTEDANAQHYEVPAALFAIALGPHLKYSCAEFGPGVTDLGAAEAAMLARTSERAELADGMRILELGCGWGSLSLWMAQHYPKASILAVSNSRSQREFILARASERGITNLEVEVADMRAFTTTRRFDRVVSVEMFEHMRNWGELFARVDRWLDPGGKLFIHVFCHREHAYLFETEGEDDWMGRHFFTGGMMPADGLVARFQEDLVLEQQWRHSGRHYRDTAEAWLKNLDDGRDRALPVLVERYGADHARLWLGRWRIFFMACAELFGWNGGEEWWVAHYRLAKRSGASR